MKQTYRRALETAIDFGSQFSESTVRSLQTQYVDVQRVFSVKFL